MNLLHQGDPLMPLAEKASKWSRKPELKKAETKRSSSPDGLPKKQANGLPKKQAKCLPKKQAKFFLHNKFTISCT